MDKKVTKTTKKVKAKKTEKAKETTQGVILCAVGHHYWGKLAENLAMSLKSSCPELKITLAKAGNVNIEMRNLFHKVVNIPENYYHIGEKQEMLMIKAYLDKLSPYDRTIYLDCDTLWLPQRSIDGLFKELKGNLITMQNRSFQSIENPTKGFGVWAETQDVIDAYKFKQGKYYNLSTEFM